VEEKHRENSRNLHWIPWSPSLNSKSPTFEVKPHEPRKITTTERETIGSQKLNNYQSFPKPRRINLSFDKTKS
jgi:hypothetical protein